MYAVLDDDPTMPTVADSGRNFEISVLKEVYSAKYSMVPLTSDIFTKYSIHRAL
jgi:hypothetical protein